ncbi:MAG: BatA and WFA domain-containing protein [Anaerolineae bacterium]|nr:BatA and WFA domain-containing protein [Anaerolineae bacterium]
MSFLTPTFLALAALAVPIIILYMLRLRRREVPISSILLWQRLMQDREANAPWQKLRRNLLLLLQLLILAALVIALARPFIPIPSVAAGSVALLIDASASMNATDMPGGATRFEAAISQARALIGDLASDEVMTIITVGTSPNVISPPSGDQVVLREALRRAEPTQASADWEAALALAGASIAGRENASVVILSDGGLPDNLPALTVPIRYIQIGREASNLAISALATRPQEDEPQLFAAVTNYADQDADVILSLEIDGELLTAERVNVPAGKTANRTFTALPASTRVIRAWLSAPVEGGISDYLPVDDVAYAVYTPPASGRVLIVTEGNRFLQQVFSSFPALNAFRTAPGELPQEPFDLMVLDGWLPEKLPDTHLLIIAPPASTDLFAVGDAFTGVRFARQVDDPILAFVDFKSVAIREAALVRTGGWAKPLVEAVDGPLLLAGASNGRRIAILTFDLHASDLPLRIDFPILIANLLQWYSPTQPFDAADSLRPGQPVVIRAQAATSGYRITSPDGSEQTFSVGESPLSFSATTQLGIYRVELLSGSQVETEASFAVNLFSPDESRIAPVDAIVVGETEIGGKADRDEYGLRELWPWLAAAALAVLIIEWWVYHRGSTLPWRAEEKPGVASNQQ